MAHVITRIDYTPSEGLRRELEAQRASAPGPDALERSQHETDAAAFAREYEARSVATREVAARVRDLGPALRIVDVGVGGGDSSLFLAASGHAVTVVEPSPDCCRLIEWRARKLGLSLAIYECPGEAMGAVPERGFDLVVFNASFHHCDDPLGALRNAWALLAPGGHVLLVNEPILRFYQTEAGFQRRLIEDPVGAGHYGGNEHSYHRSRYLELLTRAGFDPLERLHGRYASPRSAIEDYVWRKIDGQAVYGLPALLARGAWLLAVERALRLPLAETLLTRLSLLQVTFLGRKGACNP